MHLAIITGIIGYGVYVHVTSAPVLYAIALVSGIANMTGNLVQLDIAARLVPVRLAATCFAVLMALAYVASGVSEALGSWLHERLTAVHGGVLAYQAVVVLSAALAAACWAQVPRLKREVPEWWRA